MKTCQRFVLGFLLVWGALELSAWKLNAQENLDVSSASNTTELDEAIQKGEWEKVVSIANPDGSKAIQELSDSELYALGLAYLNLESAKKAKPYLLQHLERNPNSTVTVELLAEVAYRRRDTKSLEQYLELRPGNVNVLISASKRYESMAYDQLDKELPETHIEFSTLRNFKPGRSAANEYFEKAQDFIRQAIAANPDSYEARIRMALLQRNLDNDQAAIEQLLVANQIDPLSQDHYFMLAQLYQRVGEFENAFDAINMAIKAKPKLYPELMMLRAEIYSELGQYDKATEDLRLVFEKDHNHRTVRGALGDAAYGDKNYSLALFAYRESYRTDNKIGALAKIARCVFELGQDELAAAYINHAVQRSQEKNEDFRVPSDWHFTRGRALWNLDKKIDAATDLLSAYQKDPTNQEKAEWALFAFKEIEDPHGMIEVARLWGLNKSVSESFQILGYVQRTWKYPVAKNHLGDRVVGHNRRMLYVTALIHANDGSPKTAYFAWSQAFYDWNLWACWLAVVADQERAARRGFRSLVRSDTERTKQRAAAGLSFIELRSGNVAGVRENLELIELAYLKSSTLPISTYAEVLEDPAKVSELGVYDLAGIFGYYFESENGMKGLVVKGLLPGSPLKRSEPMVMPDDVILEIDNIRLDDFDRIEELHKRKPAGDQINLKVRRGETVFDVSIDVKESTDSILSALKATREK